MTKCIFIATYHFTIYAHITDFTTALITIIKVGACPPVLAWIRNAVVNSDITKIAGVSGNAGAFYPSLIRRFTCALLSTYWVAGTNPRAFLLAKEPGRTFAEAIVLGTKTVLMPAAFMITRVSGIPSHLACLNYDPFPSQIFLGLPFRPVTHLYLWSWLEGAAAGVVLNCQRIDRTETTMAGGAVRRHDMEKIIAEALGEALFVIFRVRVDVISIMVEL